MLDDGVPWSQTAAVSGSRAGVTCPHSFKAM